MPPLNRGGFYAKGRGIRPARIPAKQGLILYSRLDVAAAAATAIQLRKLRDNAIPIGGRAGDTAQRSMELQLVDLVLHVGHTITADGVQNLLGLGGGVCVDAGRIHGGVVVVAIQETLGLAAALLVVKPHLIDSGIDSGEALAQVTLQTVKACGLGIAKTANGVLQVVEVHSVTQACLGDRIAVCATIAPEAAAEQARQQEQGEDPEEAHAVSAPTETVITASNGGYIGEGIRIFHRFFSFRKAKNL